MMSSLAKYLESLPDEDGDSFLTQIQVLFLSDFIGKQQVPDQEEGDSLNNSPRPADSDELTYDQLISEERPLEGRRDPDPDSGSVLDNISKTTGKLSEENDTMVLHMGSVLSSEHDYLLWCEMIYLFFIYYFVS